MKRVNFWQFLVRYWQGLETVTFTFTFSRNKEFLQRQKLFKRTHYALYTNEDGEVVQIGPERNSLEDARTDARHWKQEHQAEDE